MCDFGGSLESTYYQNKKFLDKIDGVVEQKDFEDDRLKFFYNAEECVKKEKSNVLVLSSILQYIEKSYELLDDILKNKFDYILIDRNSFSKGLERITLQVVPPAIYEASYPRHFFDESIFMQYFLKKQYSVIESFSGQDDETENCIFKGIILEKINA